MADGHLGKCKECARADVIANRVSKLAYYTEYDKIRDSLPHRLKLRREYARINPEIVRRIKDAWAERNPHKRKAHHTLNNAIRDGHIMRLPCEVCGDLESEGHHDDYSKPLDVRWLCDKHHKEHHKNEKNIQRRNRADLPEM